MRLRLASDGDGIEMDMRLRLGVQNQLSHPATDFGSDSGPVRQKVESQISVCEKSGVNTLRVPKRIVSSAQGILPPILDLCVKKAGVNLFFSPAPDSLAAHFGSVHTFTGA